jgi:phage baseplate assembly protein W
MATVTTNVVRNFKDLDLNFTIHPVKKDINKHVGVNAVINSIKNLVLYNNYERPFYPEFGSNLRKLLFENVDDFTSSMIEREISEMISLYEPRCQVNQIVARSSPDENGFYVELNFFVINVSDPIKITFFLERIR